MLMSFRQIRITSWNYDESTSVMRTDFIVETEVKEGTETNMLLGLLPHQWANLAADSPYPENTVMKPFAAK